MCSDVYLMTFTYVVSAHLFYSILSQTKVLLIVEIVRAVPVKNRTPWWTVDNFSGEGGGIQSEQIRGVYWSDVTVLSILCQTSHEIRDGDPRSRCLFSSLKPEAEKPETKNNTNS